MTSRKANQARFVGVAPWLFRKRWVAGLLSLFAFCSPAWAQIPSLPGAGAGAGAGGAASALGAGAGAGTPAASPTTLGGFLGLSSSNLQACRAKLCSCQIGQMLNSLLSGPVGALSGGFICPLCPPPTPAQIAALANKPNGGAESAAAKIQASEADCKARVAAVEYLGTVDCNRFPEAKKALLAALREDPCECVRFAAARSLNSGCCCDQEVMEKLKICVAGEKKGGPAETSCRVKAAAFSALQNCLMRVPEEEAPPPRRAAPEGGEGLPEPIPDAKKRVKPEGTTMNTIDTSTVTTSLKAANPRVRTIEEELKTKPFAQTIKEARQTLFEAARYPQASATLPPGKRSVYQALLKARKDIEGKSRPNPKDPGPGRDPGVTPSTYGPAPASAPGQANLIPAQLPGSEPSASGESQQQTETENPQSSSPAKRGLFGLLLKP
ncbi:MAG: hypothetical protein ACLQU5_28625 [Isosphaeraceae bacterium]